MVITDEPGIYIAGRFGIRIEDTVLITKYAAQNLTLSDKSYIVVGQQKNAFGNYIQMHLFYFILDINEFNESPLNILVLESS